MQLVWAHACPTRAWHFRSRCAASSVPQASLKGGGGAGGMGGMNFGGAPGAGGDADDEAGDSDDDLPDLEVDDRAPAPAAAE